MVGLVEDAVAAFKRCPFRFCYELSTAYNLVRLTLMLSSMHEKSSSIKRMQMLI